MTILTTADKVLTLVDEMRGRPRSRFHRSPENAVSVEQNAYSNLEQMLDPCPTTLLLLELTMLHEVPSPRRDVDNQGSSANSSSLDSPTVVSRLEAIEVFLGFPATSPRPAPQDDVAHRLPDGELPFHGVWTAAAHLKTPRCGHVK